MLKQLIHKILVLVVVWFVIVVVLNWGFVIWQWQEIWTASWGVGQVGGWIIACMIIGLFLVVFPLVYLAFTKYIVIWTVVSIAWNQLREVLLPSFLFVLSQQLWHHRERVGTHATRVQTSYEVWLAKHTRVVRRTIKTTMRHLPLLGATEEVVGSLHMANYTSPQELQAELHKRLEPYLQRPQGGILTRWLVACNLFCIVTVFVILQIVG